MRVLLTGCTPRQAHFVDDAYFTYFVGLRAALLEAGHAVTWRSVAVGEELTDAFDVAIVGLHGMLTMAAQRYRFGALWTVARLPHVVLYQDWHVRSTVQQLRSTSASFWKCSHITGGETMREWERAAKTHATFDDVRDRLGRVGTSTLLCMFPWANAGLDRFLHRQPCTEVWRWTPDCFNPYRGPTGSVAKLRRWSLSSLYAENAWDVPDVAWPVARVHRPPGERAQSGGRVRGKDGTAWSATRELDVLRRDVERSWGVLLPHYGKECLPGWWRSRYWTTALAGSVLVGDVDEVGGAGAPYDLEVDQVEAATDVELARMSRRQLDFLTDDHVYRPDGYSAAGLSSFVTDQAAGPLAPDAAPTRGTEPRELTESSGQPDEGRV